MRAASSSMNCAFDLSGLGQNFRGFKIMKLSATLTGTASVAINGCSRQQSSFDIT